VKRRTLYIVLALAAVAAVAFWYFVMRKPAAPGGQKVDPWTALINGLFPRVSGGYEGDGWSFRAELGSGAG